MKMQADSDGSTHSPSDRGVRRWMLFVRRAHMYFGILLMPWALLYGVSGYLFNHPTHFQETNLRAFGPEFLQGTFLEGGLSALQSAEQVVESLNARFGEAGILSLDPSSPPSFVSDFIFASADTERETIQLLLYRDGSGGTLYTSKKPVVDESLPAKARFDIAFNSTNRNLAREGGAERLEAKTPGPDSTPLHIEPMDPSSLLKSIETVAARLDRRFADLKFRITSTPDLQFQVIDQAQSWTTRYNAITGTVSSKLTSAASVESPTWRRFLTRLHTSHGYPLDWSTRWVWAIIVDVMAFVLVFWGVSGLIMWWQIKRTRPLGTVVLAISLTLAIVVGSGMLQGMR